jgi:D-alanine-D-alanine ligase-like ATP-grasp enzyme
LHALFHQLIAKIFLSNCSDYNSLALRRACRSKAQARAVFEKLQLPYAQGDTFLTPIKAFNFAKKHGFPLVVKPNVGGFSRGAHFPITHKMALFKASILVKIWWPVSIIEQHLQGKNYRVVMTKFGLMSILRRHPPFVIGNGKNNISELIDAENQIRLDMDLTPIIQSIPKNNAIKNYLKQQKLHLNSVPNDQQRIYLHQKISLNLGASVEVVDKNKISQQNKNDLEQVLSYFNGNILGIDVICAQGIEVDFKAQKSIFLELNSRPFLKMHDKPRYGAPEDLSFFYQKLNQLSIQDHEKF